MKSELGSIYIAKDGRKFASKKEAQRHELTLAPEYIKVPVYFHNDDEGNVVYDLDEMECELEANILKELHIDCSVEIKEK